jgi:hypothetical protein
MSHHREDSLKRPDIGKLYPAMNELGINNFKIVLLEIVKFVDKEELRAAEFEWIKKLDSVNSGYNTCHDTKFSKESVLKRDKAQIKHFKEKNPDVGIYRRVERKNEARWVCAWSSDNFILKTKSFSVSKYGDDIAKQMATDYRNEQVKKIEKYN